MINSRKITNLDPRVRQICQKHIELCKQHGIELLVTSTFRDFEAQEALYAIGRTTEVTKRTVTNAKAGQSWHNFAVAWDVVPIVGGKPVWNATDLRWKDVIRLGKQAGAEAGDDWKSFPDRPHFQVKPAGLTLKQARIRFEATGSIF